MDVVDIVRSQVARSKRSPGQGRTTEVATRAAAPKRSKLHGESVEARGSAGHETAVPEPALQFASEAERLASFQRSLEAVFKRVEAELGPADVAHIRGIAKLSRRLEVVGRTLLHVSIEPVSFGLGVASLSAHKALELMEIGHTALHGTYDKLEGAEAFRAKTFVWRAPIDEKSWCVGHNVRHHQYTNIAGRDPDLDFGGLRLSPRIRHKWLHRLQPLTNFVSWSGFANGINLHVTGLLDVYFGKGDLAERKERDWPSIRAAHKTFLSKYIRYHAREYVLFPVLAGPFFWKVLLGNVLSDVGRDLYAGAIIYCGHVGAHDFPEHTRAGSRAAFYVMQVEAASNVDLSPWMSVLAGGLDKQIEHHLFPRLPPNRLREIAPEVKAICKAHGVSYQSDSWRRSLTKVVKTLGKLSLHDAA
jgi:linoleoyl-CoA desaturase